MVPHPKYSKYLNSVNVFLPSNDKHVGFSKDMVFEEVRNFEQKGQSKNKFAFKFFENIESW